MLNIETWKKNEILRTISKEIPKNDIKKHTKLAKEMLKYTRNPDNGWIWLAAPQVWYNIRLIIVWLIPNRETEEAFPFVAMFNPKVEEHSTDKDLDVEWCLSVPWEKGKVKRYHRIKLTYLDEKAKQKTLILEWLPARVVQHEIDHLDWVLFTDKVEK